MNVNKYIEAGQIDFKNSLKILNKSINSKFLERLIFFLETNINPKIVISPWFYLFYYNFAIKKLNNVGTIELEDNFENINFNSFFKNDFTILKFYSKNLNNFCWETLLKLLQEGGDFVSDVEEPNNETFIFNEKKILEAKNIIGIIDPQLSELMNKLQNTVILCKPGHESRKINNSFGGATCFFFRGGSVLNSSFKFNLATTLEKLVHEYAHNELFVLGQDERLCLNSDKDIHKVSIRSDKRPMNGIIHSFYVVVRVLEFFTKLSIHSPKRDFDIEKDFESDFREIIKSQLVFGQSSLSKIKEYADLTNTGKEIINFSEIKFNNSLSIIKKNNEIHL